MADPWANFEQVAAPSAKPEATRPTDGWGQFDEVGPAAGSPSKSASATKEAPPPSTPIGTNDVVRAAGRGIPIVGGLLNKLDAATNATLAPVVEPFLEKGADTLDQPSWGERYQRSLDIQNAKDQQFATQHPVANTAGEIAGGVASLVPAAATRIGATALGIGAGSLPVRMGLSSATNAAISGADAAVRGEDAGNAAKTGAIVGAGLPIVGQVAGRAFDAIAGRATRPNFAGSATGPVSRALADDALTAPAIQQRLTELGPQGMLADLGPNLRGQAEAIAASPGAGQRTVLDAVHARTNAAPGRISGDLDAAMGAPVNPTQEIENILTRRQQQAAPLYRQAYQQPVAMTQDMSEALQTPGAQRAIARATTLSQNEGVTGPLNLNVRSLDLIQRSLDDMASTAARSGANNQARILGNLRDRIVNEVEGQVPAWRAARQLYRSESATAEALDQGRGIFSNSVAPDELGAMMRGMSHAERDAFTQGARAAVADVMGGARNDANAARALFQKGWTVDKLNQIIGPQATTRLVGALQREGTFFGTSSGITGNSRTAARQTAQQEFPSPFGGDPHVPLTLGDIATYVPRKIANAVAGSAQRARSAQVSQDAARVLTATGADRDAIVQQIAAAAARRAAISGMRPIVQAGTVLSGDAGQRALSR